MAIAPTGAIYKSLIFDGEDSRDYGVYITGQAVYNAPERDVEMISIPGRNGSFALDKGRFQNIEVTYPAGIFADTESDFAEAISDFRNFLCSRNGYVRLSDEYNPNEYRMAVYKSGLEVSPAQLKAGEFDITFDCKPQRYLLFGEEPITIGEWHETETASGTIASFEAKEGDAVKSLVVDIEPLQSGSGTPSPTNIRPISGYDSVVVTVADDHETPTVSNTYTINLNGTRYGGTLDVVSGVLTVDRGFVTFNGSENWSKSSAVTACDVFITTVSGADFSKDAILSAFYYEKRQNVNTIGKAWLGTSNIQLRIGFSEYGTNTVDTFKTWLGSNNVQLCYPLATPTTVQLTAQEVELLVGLNQIWANSGDVEVEYGTAPNVVYNPTLFESSPMLEVEGYGSININDDTVLVENKELGRIKISDSSTSQSVYLDVSNLETGDEITSSQDPYYVLDMKTIQDTKLSVNVVSGPAEVTTISKRQKKIRVTSNLNSAPPKNGTAETKTVTVQLHITVSGVGEYDATLQLNTIYSATNNDIMLSPARADFPSTSVVKYTSSYRHYPYYGDSTKSVLPSPMYIDLDIGEAYGVIGGEPLSFDNLVTLPAELPKLKSGANTITADNTITDLKVVPRYWKV